MIKTTNNTILFTFPDHESNSSLKVSFQRTFRQEQPKKPLPIGLGSMSLKRIKKQLIIPMYLNEAARLFYSVHKHEDVERDFVYKIRVYFGDEINNLKRLTSSDGYLLRCHFKNNNGQLSSTPFQKTYKDQDMFMKLVVRLVPKDENNEIKKDKTNIKIPTIIRNKQGTIKEITQECIIKIISPEKWHKLTQTKLPYNQLSEAKYQKQGLDYPALEKEENYGELEANIIDDYIDIDDIPLPFLETIKI